MGAVVDVETQQTAAAETGKTTESDAAKIRAWRCDNCNQAVVLAPLKPRGKTLSKFYGRWTHVVDSICEKAKWHGQILHRGPRKRPGAPGELAEA